MGTIAAVIFLSGAMAMAASEPRPLDEHLSPAKAAVLGVVEGLTEYLPVSSTGHLILANYALHLSRFTDTSNQSAGATENTHTNHLLSNDMEKTPGVDAFDIVIQLGAILAVLGLYRKRVKQMALGLAGKDTAGRRLLMNLVVAFLPAAAVGLLAHHWITDHLFNPMSVIGAMAVGGVLMIVVEHFFWRRRRDTKRTSNVCDVQLWQAVVIGAAQVLAMWPGTSRSMITMLAALVVGLDMVASAEFSFLLALPTLGAATCYAGYKNWGELTTSVGPEAMIIGLVVSGVVAALAIKGFVRWLSGHGLLPFGIYRLAAAGALLAYFYAMTGA